MSDLTLMATQGFFGEAEDRIAALGTQGFYQDVVFIPPDILLLEIGISSSRGAGGDIAIIRPRGAIGIVSSRSGGDPDVV